MLMQAMNLLLCVTTALIQTLPSVSIAVSVLKQLIFAINSSTAQTVQMSRRPGPRHRSLLGPVVLNVDKKTQFVVLAFLMCVLQFAMVCKSALTGGMNF